MFLSVRSSFGLSQGAINLVLYFLAAFGQQIAQGRRVGRLAWWREPRDLRWPIRGFRRADAGQHTRCLRDGTRPSRRTRMTALGTVSDTRLFFVDRVMVRRAGPNSWPGLGRQARSSAYAWRRVFRPPSFVTFAHRRRGPRGWPGLGC